MRRLFEDLVVSRPAAGPRTRSVAVPLSMGLHLAVAAALVALPVLTSEALPKAIASPLETPIFRIAPPPGGRATLRRRPTTPDAVRPRQQATLQLNTDPVPVQATQDVLDDSAPTGPADEGSVSCTSLCDGIGEPDGDGPGLGDGPSGDGEPITFVRPGGEIQPPTKLRHVNPDYPELAKRAGVSGVVIVECVIDTTGRVADARVLKGHPLLNAAAVTAVQQWLYTATRLNGVPVSVIMTVTVRFELRR